MTALTERAWTLVGRIRRVNPHALDGVLALAFTAVALGTVLARVDGDGPYREDDFLGLALLLLQTLPLAARTVSPLAALAVSSAAISLHIAVGYEGVEAGTFAALVILYSAASLTDIRRGVLAALMTVTAISVYFGTDRGELDLTNAVTTYALYAAAWGLGIYVRSRREYTEVVEDRATLLEREREIRAREAVADERARIARELHDMVGHALNLIVIQSGGAQRVLDSNPGQARESLSSIESTGRQALADMERMLGMLRTAEDGEETLSPQPTLSQIESLAAQVRDAGLPVEVEVEGTAAEIPASIDLSAYRIIQEALTNSLKHANAATARVSVRYEEEGIEIQIADDGRGVSGEQLDKATSGRGLVGMQERVALFGGDLEVGPRAGGGFRVRAWLPFQQGAE